MDCPKCGTEMLWKNLEEDRCHVCNPSEGYDPDTATHVYEQMSDEQINQKVLKAIHGDVVDYWALSDCGTFLYDCGPVGDQLFTIDLKDYCNNPADAWPVILENKISIIHEEGEWYAVHGFYTNLDGEAICEIECSDPTGNPFRCAMIVFLMMQDGVSEIDPHP